ncbi:5-formyltetrahydrofolate cyclo-ligase [Corynebacterium lizhenjunii]|nr:5-formyltetrahydrofolate cyclo-ligase [Corynebacterium lizhenjunii]
MSTAAHISHRKQQLRAQLQRARQQLNSEAAKSADTAIRAHICRLAQGRTVAAYAPMAGEPGGAQLVPELADAATQLWLPISGPAGQLLWARYTGPDSLAPGALGIAEPTGQRRDSTVLAELDLIVVPALGCTPDGVRLGKGAGYYDRALAGVSTTTAVLLYPGEVRADIPVEDHDARMDMHISPAGVEPFGS